MPAEPSSWLETIIHVAERLRSPLAVAGLVLLALYAISRNLLERVQLTRLTPEGSSAFLHTMLQQVFVVALVTIVLSIVAYVVPQVLPKSLFIPAPRLEYAVAVFRMIDPGEDRLAQILQTIELYPGFPYYSRESDHPSAWPPRVNADRQKLFAAYERFFSDADVRARLAADQTFDDRAIQLLSSGPRDRSGKTQLIEYIAAGRHHLLKALETGMPTLQAVLGEAGTARFLQLEDERAAVREWFPNRLAVVRVRSSGKPDVLNLGVELEIAGMLYDGVVDADPDKVRKASWDAGAQRVSFERLPSGYTAQVRIWYQYQSLDEKTFPDKIDLINELTQGVRVVNISASRTQVRYDRNLLQDFSGYDRLYFGDAQKKDSYEDELAALMKPRYEAATEHMKHYQATHPTRIDLEPSKLATSDIPDEQITSIWLTFRSPAGHPYTAVHVFRHPGGPYVLLSSTYRDEAALKTVAAQIATEYAGSAEAEVSDRADDLCIVISAPGGFTQASVAAKAAHLAAAGYNQVKVSKLHYETEPDD